MFNILNHVPRVIISVSWLRNTYVHLAWMQFASKLMQRILAQWHLVFGFCFDQFCHTDQVSSEIRSAQHFFVLIILYNNFCKKLINITLICLTTDAAKRYGIVIVVHLIDCNVRALSQRWRHISSFRSQLDRKMHDKSDRYVKRT